MQVCSTNMVNEERISLPFTPKNLRQAADLWTAVMVTTWFGKDPSKVYYHLPQIAVYQPSGIPVEPANIEQFI